MQCMNCGKEVASNAKRCKFCKADFEALPNVPPGELLQLLQASGMDAKDMEQMHKLAMETDSVDEFTNAILIGDCPKCGSKKVEDCGEVSGINDLTVAQCLDCGVRWCAECGYQLKKEEMECPHWNVCHKCPEEDDCPYIVDATECTKVAKWMKSVGLPLRL